MNAQQERRQDLKDNHNIRMINRHVWIEDFAVMENTEQVKSNYMMHVIRANSYARKAVRRIRTAKRDGRAHHVAQFTQALLDIRVIARHWLRNAQELNQ